MKLTWKHQKPVYKNPYPLYNHKWQYNGVAPWDEIVAWCDKNIKGYSYIQFETIWFSRQQDYNWFMLRWS
jgi:hypothetical protein